jgi:hypothetical protein
LAEQALDDAFKQTRPGPHVKTLQEENAALREEFQKLYYDYHKPSRLESAGARDDAPRVCSACGSAQMRKNGTLASERQGARQRYSCRQCSLSIYVVLKKNERTTELHVCVTQTAMIAAETEPIVEAIASPATETEISAAQARVHYVTVDTFSYVPSGFLCLLVDFAQALGFFQIIKDIIHLPMKEVQYTQLDKIKILLAMIALGCKHIHDINHCLRPYPLLAQRLGMEKIPEQSQINRFLNSFAGQLFQLDQLFETLLRTYGLWQQQEKVNLDFDCTGLVVYGDTFELCRKGYFAGHPGSKGYQLSLTSTFGYEPREIVSLHLDPGNSHPNARFWNGIYQAAEICGLERLGVIRADAAQGSGPNIQELIELGLGFTIKGYSVLTARNFARELVHEQWDAIDLFTRVADLGLKKIYRCRYPVRTILVETLNARGRIDYFNVFTHFPSDLMSGPEVFHYYNARQSIEALIKSEKNSLHITSMKTHIVNAINKLI